MTEAEKRATETPEQTIDRLTGDLLVLALERNQTINERDEARAELRRVRDELEQVQQVIDTIREALDQLSPDDY